MKAKREYYKNYVDGKTRLKKLIYFIILLIAFGMVLYDSFINKLPFHYILFLVIGRLMSLILRHTHKVTLNEEGQWTVDRSIIGLSIIIIVMVLRVFLFPRILAELNVVFVSDALFLILIGWFLGRISLLSDKIEEKAFSGCMPPPPSKHETHKPDTAWKDDHA
jgi:hypothetical protein